MADRAVRYDFLGRDVSASAAGEKVAKTYSGLGSKLRTVGKGIALALGGVAVGGVALLGHAMVQGAKDAQSYQTLAAKTTAVIKSTGNQARISVKGIQGLAGSLESLSGVDEELIIQGENVLATFTRVRNETGKGNDIFNQATKAALNMSVALGQDMQSSVVQLGKALNDPIKGITALSRVGVSFTQQQKDQIRTLVEHGRVMDAQKIILKELETEFGGAAKAAGSGLGGALARLQDAWGDMFRDIMGKALPGLTHLTDWIAQTGVPAFSGFLSFLQEQVGPKIAAALATLKDRLPDIDLSAVGKRMSEQAQQWGGAIIAGVKRAMDTGDWSGLGAILADKVSEAGGKLVEGARALVGKVDWVNLGKEVGKTAIPFAVGFVGTLADGLITAAREHPFDTFLFLISFLGIGKIGGVLARIASKIPFVRIIAPMLEGLNRITEPINSAIGRIFGPLGRAIWRGVTDGFRAQFPRAAGIIRGAFETLIVSVFSYTDDAAKAGLRVAEGFGRGIGRGIGFIAIMAGRAIRAAVAPFGRAGGWLYQAGRNLIGGLISGIVSRLGDLAGVISRAAQTVLDFWPLSPAKRGPLREHPPEVAGQNIARGLAEGMSRNAGLIEAATRRLAGGVAAGGGPATLGAGGGLAAPGPAGAGGPMVVNVYLGTDKIGEVLIDPLRKAIGSRGGSVQAVLGR